MTPLEQIIAAVLERAAGCAQVSRDVFSGCCDHTHQAIDYMGQVIRAMPVADLAKELAHLMPEAHDLTTAEGRRDFDTLLRAHLAAVEDAGLRSHAAEMVREWRAMLFGHKKSADARNEAISQRLAEFEARVFVLEMAFARLEAWK